MSKSKLFIPEKINVGFRERTDTYEGKLAYVIYWDKSGKLRKEKSWDSWRDNKIDPKEFDNVPTSGFVLNKGVGGVKGSYGWNARNEYIRVWDPRGIEFEISVANLLFILMHTNCVKRQLQGDLVYSWEGTELVLLPVNTDEYKNSIAFTDLQDGKVSAKDLVEGHVYETKRQEQLVYLGKFDWWEYKYRKSNNYKKEYLCTKKRIFINPDTKYIKDATSLSFLARNTSGLHPEYGNLLELLKNNVHSSKIVGSKLVPIKELSVKDMYDYINSSKAVGYYETNNGEYSKFVVNTDYSSPNRDRYDLYINTALTLDFKNGIFNEHYRRNESIKESLSIEELVNEINSMGLGELKLINEAGREIDYIGYYWW